MYREFKNRLEKFPGLPKSVCERKRKKLSVKIDEIMLNDENISYPCVPYVICLTHMHVFKSNDEKIWNDESENQSKHTYNNIILFSHISKRKKKSNFPN